MEQVPKEQPRRKKTALWKQILIVAGLITVRVVGLPLLFIVSLLTPFANLFAPTGLGVCQMAEQRMEVLVDATPALMALRDGADDVRVTRISEYVRDPLQKLLGRVTVYTSDGTRHYERIQSKPIRRLLNLNYVTDIELPKDGCIIVSCGDRLKPGTYVDYYLQYVPGGDEWLIARMAEDPTEYVLTNAAPEGLKRVEWSMWLTPLSDNWYFGVSMGPL